MIYAFILSHHSCQRSREPPTDSTRPLSLSLALALSQHKNAYTHPGKRHAQHTRHARPGRACRSLESGRGSASSKSSKHEQSISPGQSTHSNRRDSFPPGGGRVWQILGPIPQASGKPHESADVENKRTLNAKGTAEVGNEGGDGVADVGPVHRGEEGVGFNIFERHAARGAAN